MPAQARKAARDSLPFPETTKGGARPARFTSTPNRALHVGVATRDVSIGSARWSTQQRGLVRGE